MSTMVERVAQAIIGSPPIETVVEREDGTYLQRDFERTARAAIEAMMEPTEAMLEDGWAAGESTFEYDNVGAEVPEAVFKAMIQAALKEKA